MCLRRGELHDAFQPFKVLIKRVFNRALNRGGMREHPPCQPDRPESRKATANPPHRPSGIPRRDVGPVRDIPGLRIVTSLSNSFRSRTANEQAERKRECARCPGCRR